MLCIPSRQSISYQAISHCGSTQCQQQHQKQHTQSTQRPDQTCKPGRSYSVKSSQHSHVKRKAKVDKASASFIWLFSATLVCVATVGQAQTAALGTCPVSIDYAVSLGQGGGDNSDVPVFVGSVGITNNANVSLSLSLSHSLALKPLCRVSAMITTDYCLQVQCT